MTLDQAIHLGSVLLVAIIIPFINKSSSATTALKEAVLGLTYEMKNVGERLQKVEDFVEDHRDTIVSIGKYSVSKASEK